MGRWLFLPSLLLSSSLLFAQPEGAHVVSGQVHLKESGTTLEVHASDQAMVAWDQFSIRHGETTHFIQPSSSSLIVNRVHGNVSQIDGLLQANGKVYLVNPAGIVVGKEGVIRTAGFLATTLDLKEGDFFLGHDLLFEGQSGAKIIHLGKMEAIGGDIFLLARSVVSEGSMQAKEGVVGIAAAHEVLLKAEGTQRLFVACRAATEKDEVGIDQQGTIEASVAQLCADGNLYRLAINQTGMIDATGVRIEEGRVFLVADEGLSRCAGTVVAKSVEGKGGTVHLLGQQVEVVEGASIDTSGSLGGGEILIGGDFQGKNPEVKNASLSTVEKGAFVRADALEEGKGGKVIVWSDGDTRMHGTITARGGSQSGDGGFVEVSAKEWMSCSMDVNTAAPHGIAGEFLLDPTSITVDNNTTTVGLLCPFTNLTGASVTIKASDLQTCLTANNVTLSTASSGAGTGRITFNGSSFAFSWSSANNLTLVANENIEVDGTLVNIGANAPTLTLQATQDIVFKSGTNTATNVIGFGTNVTTPDSTRGTLSMTAGGDVQIAPSVAGHPLHVAAQTMSITAGGDITIGQAAVDSINVSCGGSMTLQAGGGMSLLGTATNNAFVDFSVAGSGTFTIGGGLTLLGGSATTTPVTLSVTGSSTFTIGGSILMLGGSKPTTQAAMALTGGGALSVGGSVTVDGGSDTDAYAQISSPKQVLFNLIGGDLTLIGGSGSGAFAQIGSIVSINNVGGNVLVQGRSNNNTYAQIGGSSTLINNVLGSVTLLAGSGPASSAYAQIGPGNVTIANILQDINVTGQTGNFAKIGAGGTINIDQMGGSIVLTGGATTGATAQIGEGIIAITGVGQDIRLTGGTAGGSSFALIGNNVAGASDITIRGVGGSVILQGGSATTDSFAQIGTVTGAGGNITMNSIGGNISVTGGSGGALAHAIIGHTYGDGLARTGNISITDVGGSISVVGGTNDPSNFAQIGAASPISNANSVVNVNVDIERVAGNLLIQSQQASAMIGLGNLGDADSDTLSGSVNVAVKGNAQVNASSFGGFAFPAGVGFLGFNSGINTLTFSSPLVALSGRDVTLNGNGNAMDATTAAFVGVYNLDALLPINASLGHVSVSALNDVVLNGGANGDAAIGAFSAHLANLATASLVTVSAGGNVFVNPSATNTAVILTNNPTVPTSRVLNGLVTAGNITVGNGSPIDALVFANNDLTLIANQDIVLHQNAVVETAHGTLTFVVDNANPTSPEIGSGRLIIDAGAIVHSGGALRLFTARRSQNQINAPLNGVPFVPGPYLVNSSTEQWGTYYPSSFGGFPFTIFYKDAIPPYINLYAQIYTQLFEELHLYDELFFQAKCFLFQYDKECYNIRLFPGGMMSSFDLFDEEVYETLEQVF